MKKKLLSTLLCVAMALGTLAGCGAKETTSDNVVVETEEHVENETTTNEEVEVENETNDIVVDAERPEGAEVGKVVYTDWGTYTIVSSENGMDNIEVQFNGICFKATVPQDMGALSSYDPGEKLVLNNELKTKWLTLFYSSTSMEDKTKDDAYTKEELRSFWKDSTYEDGYYFEKEWLNDNVLSIVYEADYYNTTTNRQTYGYAVYLIDYEKGDCCQFYYTELSEIANKDVAKIVAESITLVSDEDLESYNNGVVELDNSGNIDANYLENYGLEKDALVLPDNTNVVDQNNMLMATANNMSLANATEVLNKFVSTMEAYDNMGNVVTSPVEIPMQGNSGYLELFYKVNDTWNEIIFMYDIVGTNEVFTTSIMKNVTVSF